MSRYIDADKFRQRLKVRQLTHKDDMTERHECGCIIEMLDNAPTADVVEVVRCKDCKYYKNGGCDLHSEPKERRPYERWTVDVRENDYCSYGKKKRRRK